MKIIDAILEVLSDGKQQWDGLGHELIDFTRKATQAKRM